MKAKITILFAFIIFYTLHVYAYPGKIVKTLDMQLKFATGLTFDGSNLWAADYKLDLLVCFDPLTGEKIREIKSPGFWPMGLAWDGEYLWNIDKKQKKIFKVDPLDGTILFAVDAPGDDPEGLMWDGETLWVSDPREDKIMMIDLSDGTAVKFFDAPSRNVQGICFDGEYIWAADRMEDELYMIDKDNGEVIIVTDSPGPYPRGIAFDGNYLWCVDYETDLLYKLIRKDDELFRLRVQRTAEVTLTHQVTPYGSGKLKNLDVYLAIPVDLNQQKITGVNFVPDNHKIVTDRWDQKYAHFNYADIESGSTVESVMKVEAEISAVDYFIFPDNCGTLKEIPGEIIGTYTDDGSKYMITDPFIKSTAEELAGSENNPYWITRKIFDYVRNKLEYKLEGGWNVAPVVLQRGTGSCSEYTFSFIALCRAAGIPARYVGSIVVRGDDASLDEVFHRWPEVYLPNYGWIPMDPQGGDKELPRDRAMNIGHLSNRFLITTACGGDSPFMGWYYNSYETYETDPQVKVNIEAFGEWEPK